MNQADVKKVLDDYVSADSPKAHTEAYMNVVKVSVDKMSVIYDYFKKPEANPEVKPVEKEMPASGPMLLK